MGNLHGGEGGRTVAGVAPMIALRPIGRENWRAALALRVDPAQLPFLADSQPVVAIALAKAYIRPDGREWHPYGLYAGEALVGFVAVAHDAADGSCWLYHYFIDLAHQGRGYGGAGLRATLALVAAPPFAARAVLLTVNPANAVGRRVYTRAGFRPTGAVLHGEQVWRLALGKRHLRPPPTGPASRAMARLSRPISSLRA